LPCIEKVLPVWLAQAGLRDKEENLLHNESQLMHLVESDCTNRISEVAQVSLEWEGTLVARLRLKQEELEAGVLDVKKGSKVKRLVLLKMLAIFTTRIMMTMMIRIMKRVTTMRIMTRMTPRRGLTKMTTR
jgi:hypothetical protein